MCSTLHLRQCGFKAPDKTVGAADMMVVTVHLETNKDLSVASDDVKINRESEWNMDV